MGNILKSPLLGIREVEQLAVCSTQGFNLYFKHRLSIKTSLTSASASRTRAFFIPYVSGVVG